jgi:membrane-associated phospholipid phosphatase
MASKNPILQSLKAYDLVISAFYIFLTVYIIAFYPLIPRNNFYIVHNIFIIAFSIFIAWSDKKYNNKFWRLLHYFYIAPLILITFEELYFLIKPVRQVDFDWLFIKIDHWIFGVNPTEVLYKIACPLLTEILQIVYGLFYFLPIILILALIRKKRYKASDYAVFSIIYGFYLSYLGYFALPGIGPRFTLHEFKNLNKELPGLVLTEPLREFTNNGESIHKDTPNPADVVQRDVFPSGHTMLTLITMYLAIKLRSRSRYFIVPVGGLLIFATVYLRYHYVIDLIGGAAFMMFSLWTGRLLFNWWQRKLGNDEFYWAQDQKELEFKH